MLWLLWSYARKNVSSILFRYTVVSSVQGKYDNGEKFIYTQALVLFMCAANTVFAWGLRPKRDVDTVPIKVYGICSASYLGAMICSNQALQYLPYPTQVTLYGIHYFGASFSISSFLTQYLGAC